jgi:hypothetical protein
MMPKDRGTSGFRTDEIKRALETLFDSGVVVELTAVKDRITASGYLEHHKALPEKVTKLDDRASTT